jgi:hypothetical protein
MIFVWNKDQTKLTGVYRDWDKDKNKPIGPNDIGYFWHFITCDYEHYKKFHMNSKQV